MDRDREKCLASAALCPMPGCDTLAITYRSRQSASQNDGWLEVGFVCPRCGVEFYSAPGELLFQAIPEGWLRGGVSQA